MLERLGPPEEIVEAAEPEPTAAAPVRTGKLEIAALVALIVPFVGWLAGIVLVLISRAWSNREKAVGITLALLPVLVPLLVLVAESSPDASTPVPPSPDTASAEIPESDTSTSEVLAFALLLFAGLPSAIYLGLRLRRGPSVEHA